MALPRIIQKVVDLTSDFLAHKGQVSTLDKTGHSKPGLGLNVTEDGTYAVKLSDAMNSDDSTTAASSKAVKDINDTVVLLQEQVENGLQGSAAVEPLPDTIVKRDASGEIHGNITGTARYA